MADDKPKQQDSREFADQLGAVLVGSKQAPRQADGLPPAELIAKVVEDGRAQGCICPEPKVIIHKSKEGGGAILIAHQRYCPLWRTVSEGRR